MRIPLLFRQMAFAVPLALAALTGWSQTVTDPSDKRGYDATKSQAAASMAAQAKAQQKAFNSVSPKVASNRGAAAAAAVGCFIPYDNTYTDVPTNDDGSFGPIALPFTFNLYGTSYTQVWINTNGNLTFDGPYGEYTSTGFPNAVPMVAGFWADEDTRVGGIIHYKVNPTNMIVTWDGVGYFSQHTDKLNTFQIIIGSSTDILLGPSQNVSLRYGDMQWTTGDASSGSGGFGGTPATVGVNNGNGTNYVQVGRFDQPGTVYDGPGGNNDGVDYLDNQCIGFNVSTAGNIPPSAGNLPLNNTVTVACGQTVTINPQFLAPEVNQTVNVGVNTAGLCNTTVSTTNGVTASATIAITGAACNVGTHPIVLTATDNGSPVGVTTVTINVVVTPCVAPCNNNTNTPVANPDNFTASCGPIIVTAAQLLANDTSPNGTPLAIGSVGGGGNGTVVDNGNGTYTFTPFPGYTGPASFTYLLQSAGSIFPSPATGHYYELVSAPGICWDAARTAAGARTYAGMQGYLATLNTAADVNAVKNRNAGEFWFGAADDVTEGTWQWKTGPEAGTTFYIGNGATGGATVAGQYSNWSPGEPDDYKNQWRPIGEDYGHIYGQSGLWNDLDLCGTGGQPAGYLVEYGGLEACLPVLYSMGTVNINVTNSGTGAPAIVANPDTFSDQNGALGITTAQLLANDTDAQGRALSVVSVSNGTNGATAVYRGNGIYTLYPGSGNGPWTFNYLVQLAGPVFPSTVTGHYYEFVAAPNLTWTAAKVAAASRTYNGMQGYLATITSAAETDLLKGRNPDNIWFGAADDLVEGEWRWKTGPEAGQLFYQGNGTTGGATVPGQYSNWSSGEPNDFKNQFRPGGEDYAHMYGNSGLWNDLSDNAGGSATSGYFVEYGGLEACTPVLYATGTVSIFITHHSSRATADAGKAGASVLEASPNPSNGQFSVRVVAGVEGPTQLDLFDLNGRRISALFNDSLQAGEQRVVPVNVSDVASGLYVVRMQSGKDVKVVRVAIQK